MLPVTQNQFDRNKDLICQKLLAARKIAVLCGAGVSTAAGIPDFRSPEGLYSRRFMRGNVTLRGRDLFNTSTITKVAELAIFSLVLTEMRIHARTAPLTSFHRLIQILDEKDLLQRCYTQNFDGMQTRDFPHLAPRVVELHGNNNSLICRACRQEAPGPVEKYDRDLIQTGVVECPHCRASADEAEMSGKRRKRIGYLTPKVLLNEEPLVDIQHHIDLASLTKKDSKVDLLLVVATSLRSNGPLNLLKSMARTIRERGGAIVYIDQTAASRQLSSLFDMQLQVDVQHWAASMLAFAQKLTADNRGAQMQSCILKLKEQLGLPGPVPEATSSTVPGPLPLL
ncbi:hypothetical protein FS749_004918, partial [Ceratobasidium sp. UAMH 11750]